MPILGGCLCCDLKVGSKIIGIYHLIGALCSTLAILAAWLMMMIFLGVTESVPTLEEHLRKQMEEVKDSLNQDYPDEKQDFDILLQQQQESAADIINMIQQHLDKAMIVIYVLLALSVLKVITSSMLIHGIRRDRRGLLLPFIIHESINILIGFGFMIAGFVFLGSNQITWSMAAGIFVGSGVIGVYCILVIISQYQALGIIGLHEDICMK